jgi:hypothetical protein
MPGEESAPMRFSTNHNPLPDKRGKVDTASANPLRQVPQITTPESSHHELTDAPVLAPELTFFMPASQLAEKIDRPVASVESFLRRYREKYPDCCFETDGRRRNEPKYMYRTKDVWHALLDHYRKGK